jgi:hypothetical protein
MTKKWRSGSHYSLWARPIREYEYPRLIEHMVEGGLTCVLTETTLGYQWYIQEYPLQGKAIRVVWGLSEHQYQRLMRWIFANDPFPRIEE